MVVTVTVKDNKGGNERSRPFVAGDEAEALVMASVEWDIPEDDPSVTWSAVRRNDPEGTYERALVDAEKRRLENEYYRQPAVSQRGRYGRKRR